MKHLLNTALIAISGSSIVALFAANEDPFAREMVCVYIRLCWHPPHANALYKVIYDLAVGSLISVFFYLLVVRLPDYQRRQRLKRGLKRHYKAFREGCIEIMLLVADHSYSAELPETLMDQNKFREYFMEKVTRDCDRWDDFQNNLNAYYLGELLTRMEILREELIFILNNTDIPKDQPFEFLKRLSTIIYSMKHVTLGYDESKPLAAFLWEVFAGWNLIMGYRKEDIIEKMIGEI